jgi:hypothetical protein
MNKDEATIAAKQMIDANYGSFAQTLSTAYLLADEENRKKILSVFDELFSRAYSDKVAYAAFLAKKN